MATLKKRRNVWYARIRKWNGYKQVEIQIPLKTDSKITARKRLSLINKVESDIKAGMCFSFPWMNESCSLKLIQISISEAFKEFVSVKTSEGLRSSTIERYGYALESFYKVVTENTPIASINSTVIDDYKRYWFKKHDPTTININLSKISAFLNWCSEKKYIKNSIKITKIQDSSKSIEYLSDSEFKALMQSTAVDDFYKRVFLFYRETGCRLSEPFTAELRGNWLIIQPENAKTHLKREIELSEPLVHIYQEMMAWAKLPRSNASAQTIVRKQKSLTDRISKMFKKACRYEGINNHKFHNLRDTFAVRLWAITGDIHYVSKVIGHTSVTMTEKYANFNPKRLIDDFPSLASQINKRLNSAKYAIRDTDFRDTLTKIGIPLDDKTE